MAKGQTHDKVTILFSPIVFIFVLKVNSIMINNSMEILKYSIVSILVYIFGGYMFSGDLDIKSREYNRWKLLRFIWIPYQKVFAHRSVFTHGFLLGPTIRIVYIYLIYLILCAILYSLNVINQSTEIVIKNTYLYIIYNKYVFLNIFIGLFIGSGVHTLTDMTHSFLKKNTFLVKGKKKKRKKKYFRKMA